LPYEVQVRELEERPTAEIHVVVAWQGVADALTGIFSEVMEYAGMDGIGPDGIAFGRYTPRGPEVAIEAGFTTLRLVEQKGRVQPDHMPGGEEAAPSRPLVPHARHVGPRTLRNLGSLSSYACVLAVAHVRGAFSVLITVRAPSAVRDG
jgi:hypothetical protein